MKRTRFPFALPLLLAASLCCAFVGAGCDDDDEDDATTTTTPTFTTTGGGTAQDDASTTAGGTVRQDADSTAGNPVQPDAGDVVTLTDPAEDAFTVEMPKGWMNQAYMVRAYDITRSVVTSLSPDGETLVFFGDPKMPGYMLPTPEFNENSLGANLNPMMKFSEYIPAEKYFTDYVKKRYGKLDGFKITGIAPNPKLIPVLRAQAERAGIGDVPFSTVLITFDYTDNGKPMHAMINGTTFPYKQIWMSDVSGISSSGDPMQYQDLLLRIADSSRTKPEWKAKQQADHEARMAQLREDHRNNMAGMRASTQRHEARMKAIHDAGDASMKNWYANQATSDASHRRFLNYITDENTVVTPGGQATQVESGYQRYYLNKNDNTFVGADSTTDLDDLRKRGLNPDDYEEARVKQ